MNFDFPQSPECARTPLYNNIAHRDQTGATLRSRSQCEFNAHIHQTTRTAGILHILRHTHTRRETTWEGVQQREAPKTGTHTLADTISSYAQHTRRRFTHISVRRLAIYKSDVCLSVCVLLCLWAFQYGCLGAMYIICYTHTHTHTHSQAGSRLVRSDTTDDHVFTRWRSAPELIRDLEVIVIGFVFFCNKVRAPQTLWMQQNTLRTAPWHKYNQNISPTEVTRTIETKTNNLNKFECVKSFRTRTSKKIIILLPPLPSLCWF